MKLIFLILFLLLSSTIVYGQPHDPWTVTEQCISLETDSHPNWTFDGTILFAVDGQLLSFSNYEGRLHSTSVQDSNIRGYGLLSPNQRWYALLEGSSETDGLVTVISTTEIRVYSTVDDVMYSIPWENSYSAMRRVYGHRMYWLDNTHLLYSKGGDNEIWYVINPFTDEIELWDKWFDPHHFVFELAPNGQMGISADWGDPRLQLYIDEATTVVPYRTTFGVIWHPSSQYFVALSDGQDSTGMIRLLMFDLTGEIEHIIYQTHARLNYISDPSQMSWSNDGRYLAFADQTLYIADFELKQVIDTCLTLGMYSPMAWSPDSSQLVVRDSNNQLVRSIDLEQRVSHVVTDKNGLIIGWREDTEE